MICASPTSTYAQLENDSCAPRSLAATTNSGSQARGLDLLQHLAEQNERTQNSLTRASILIVSFNTRDLTRKCLESVRKWESASEIIVVDNASHDGSAEMIQNEFPEVRLLKLSQNIGFGRANNLAMQYAVQETIVLLNSDTILENSALSHCAQVLHSSAKLAAVTPRLKGLDGVQQNTRHAVPTFRHTLQRSLWRRPMVSTETDFWIPGTCLLLKRSAINAVGGLFEPQLFIYWEDADLCARFKSHGYTLQVVDDAQILHYGGASGGGPDCSAKPGLHEWYTFGRHFWYARHRPALEGVGLWLLEFADAFRCMGRSLVRPSRRDEWQFGKTLLRTLTRQLCGLAPSFAQTKQYGRTDAQLIVVAPKSPLAEALDCALTEIGVVVIGRNEGTRLTACLNSVLKNQVPVVYVDSGSTDGSQQVARQLGARVIELDMAVPFTAARARNIGMQTLLQDGANLKYVQFIDGDCQLQEGWLPAAKEVLLANSECAIVTGALSERHPEHSVYNHLCQLEWRRPAGRVSACGGIFLGRLQALQDVGGFRDDLIAGEEPELCFRLRHKGWSIHSLTRAMACHDAAIVRFGQWWKRCVRAGLAYAQGFAMHGSSDEQYRRREVRSIAVWGLIVPLLILLTAWLTAGLSIVVAAAAYFKLWSRIRQSSLQQGLLPADASLYARYVVLGKFPQAQGLLLWLCNRCRGRSPGLIEYK